MKYLLFLFISIFLFSPNENFKKRNQPYWSVIPESDLIVDGEIIDLNETHFNFKINDFIKGQGNETINVSIWKEWTCDIRLGKLKQNRRLILFLKKQDNGSYMVINGSTGELIVNDDRTVCSNLRHKYPNVYDVKYGVTKFVNSIEYTKQKDSNNKIKHSFKRKISKEELDRIVTQSEFFKYITRGIIKSIT